MCNIHFEGDGKSMEERIKIFRELMGSVCTDEFIERLEKEARKIMDADKQPLFNLSKFDKPKEK